MATTKTAKKTVTIEVTQEPASAAEAVSRIEVEFLTGGIASDALPGTGNGDNDEPGAPDGGASAGSAKCSGGG